MFPDHLFLMTMIWLKSEVVALRIYPMKSYPEKFCKILKKAPVMESHLSSKFMDEGFAQNFEEIFREVFLNNFYERLLLYN